MNNNIHSTAIIDPNATIGSGVTIGPFTVIDANVRIDDNVYIGTNVIVKDFSTIGKDSKIFHGSVIGEIPQDTKFGGELSSLSIGQNTTVREYCTINRGTKASGSTAIGNNNLLMSYVHVAHDCIIGNDVIIANGVQIGGHVEIDDSAIIGGSTPIHQFCKVGKYSMIGGGYRIVHDIPPYVIAQGEPLQYAGINRIGLKRKGFSAESRNTIKNIYRHIFHSDTVRENYINLISRKYKESAERDEIIEFIKKSDRGILKS